MCRPCPLVHKEARRGVAPVADPVGCTYASVYDNMCEITSLTEDELRLREGGSYRSILPGSCTYNQETYGQSSSRFDGFVDRCAGRKADFSRP